ncbi:hypothetical protein ABB02_01576 [Clostridiaceae bacterium JG1575]|nr:hypothetical protein ABB02_01576 [Clostridiaceae bacterium JG1575]
MYQEFAQIYEAKIKEDFDYQRMRTYLRRRMKQAKLSGGTLLDMGCGTGNASAQLLGVFERMILCDPSRDMLALARPKFKPPMVPLFLQVCASEFSMPGQFDSILSVLDVVNYLTLQELKDYFSKSYGNLKKRGLLLLDCSTPAKLRAMAQCRTYVYDDEDYFHVWENELSEGHLDLEINSFVRTKEGLYRRVIEEQRLYLHERDEMIKLAQAVGFQVLHQSDDYEEEPWTSKTQRGVLVLLKENE